MQKTTAIVRDIKEKWKPCLVADCISSEDSDWEEDNGGNTYKTFTVKPIPWRSDRVSNFFHALDRKAKKSASQKSTMMSFVRKVGIPSDRPKPVGFPEWVYKQSS